MFFARSIIVAALTTTALVAAAPFPLQSRASLTPLTARDAFEEPPDNCGVGDECDCSGIDKNSDEFFQCVTNPNCEHCWHDIPPN